MNKEYEPIVVEFPLRGEWAAPNTPGKRIPSHGTDQFGTKYAYDFLQVDWNRKGHPCYSSSAFQYLLFGIPITKCYCYGQKIYAPFEGIVVKVETSCEENKTASLGSDLCRARRNSQWNPENGSRNTLTGNCVIIEHRNDIYAAFVHLQPGSICVAEGQKVKKGDVLGRIGHTGNSMFPHLHFQLMDSSDMTTANGLPCAFEKYEIWKDGNWQIIYNGIPNDKDRIRYHR